MCITIVPAITCSYISRIAFSRHDISFIFALLLFCCLKQVTLVIEPKDRETNTMYNQALDLLSQALEVWPNANVKFNYLEKLLSSMPPSQSSDPSTALAQGLDVMNKVLEKQPHLFIRNNINQISQVYLLQYSLLLDLKQSNAFACCAQD